MGPAEAIKSGFKKSFQFSGRASRSEYWWFLPVGLLMPAVALCVVDRSPIESSIWPSLGFIAISLLPLITLTTRRLRDTGEHVDGVRIPTIQLVGFVITLMVWRGFHDWAMTGFEDADGPGGFGLMIVFWLGSASLFLFALRFFALGLVTGSALFSQMAAPPHDTKHNRTSNPNEVPS
ncbi:MAG: DUF805 domain-containing protein [Pseudomonadota bacterium]